MTAPNHLRAWREHRGMTQARLAEAIGTNASVVSLLESGDRGLSPKWLRRLSVALGAPVGAFLDYGPDEGRADVLDAWAGVPESARPIALETMRTMTRAI
ncbi:MAG: helix-turn-helix transcriptional regulator [Pseudomonadota bacterium]